MKYTVSSNQVSFHDFTFVYSCMQECDQSRYWHAWKDFCLLISSFKSENWQTFFTTTQGGFGRIKGRPNFPPYTHSLLLAMLYVLPALMDGLKKTVLRIIPISLFVF